MQKKIQNITVFRLREKKDQLNITHRHIKDFRDRCRSESMGVIFGLPQSVIEKHQTSEQISPIKRKKSRRNNSPENEQLGDLGLQYHENLRKTILNQTRKLFKAKKKQRSFVESKNIEANFQQEESKLKRTQNMLTALSNNSASSTLSILQKTIIKDVDFYKQENQIFQLQANRLPLIKKENSRKEKMTAMYDPKYSWILPSSPSRQQIRELYTIRRKKKIVEKPQICGWDNIEINQY